MKNWVRCDQKHILVFTENTLHSCQIYIKCEISQQIFQQYSNNQFHENPSTWSRVVACERKYIPKLIVTFAILWTRQKIEKLHNGYEQTTILLFQRSIRNFTWKPTYFYCCRQRKFVLKALTCSTHRDMQLNDTQYALLCFHCNNGYAVAPHCYDMPTWPILLDIKTWYIW